MMKKIILFVLLLVGVAGKSFSCTNCPELRSDSLNVDPKAAYELYDSKYQEIQLKLISNENGRQVYTHQLNGLLTDVSTYILNNLKDGHYKLELEDELTFDLQDFHIVNKELWFPKDESAVIFQPLAEKKGRYLHISLLMSHPGVSLKLLTEKGEDPSGVNFKNEDLQKYKIDLRNFSSGKYTLVTSIGGKSYFKNLEI